MFSSKCPTVEEDSRDSAPRTSRITPLYNEKIKDFTKTYQKVTQILVSANSLILNLLIRGHVLWVRWS